MKKAIRILCGLSLMTGLSAHGQYPGITFLPFEETRYVIKSSNSKTPTENVSEADGDINGHGYVDLGLPSGLKWSTTNVGASTPDESGSYFGWGETRTKSDFTHAGCAVNDVKETQLKSMNVINNTGTLNLSHDAAHANWGGSWRMPTKKEYKELDEQCKWTWVEINGNDGWKVTGQMANQYSFQLQEYSTERQLTKTVGSVIIGVRLYVR